MDTGPLDSIRFVLAALCAQAQENKKARSLARARALHAAVARRIFLLSRPEAHYGWLGARFVPDNPTVGWLGVTLTAAGVAVAFWARWHLGANWSGVVTLKEGHELIRRGPYRTIRHPIYTGILLALLGTAVAIGEVRVLLAVAIAWLSFYLKARREESFLSEEFGPSFAEHRQHTGMFFPRFS